MVVSVLASFPTLQSRADEARARVEVARDSTDQQAMYLPGLRVSFRAMPNAIARSSLFAPVARGCRTFHHQAVLVSRADATITYTGYQLDEPKADAWMQLMYEAKNAPLGSGVTIKRAAFLRSIGHSTSGRDYKWLHETMFAFTAATIVIETRRDGILKYRIGNTRAFHMLASFEYDDEAETYKFIIDPRWKTVFSGREYALIDWRKRQEIARGQDMAKALQRLVATSSDTIQRFELAWLKGKLQYNSPMRKFRTSLLKALGELERVEVIAAGRIELSTKGKMQATWIKLGGERT
jgi:hypothetical protein